MKHPGNKLFSKVVRANLQRYVAAPKRADKSIVVSSVVSTLKESGSKFVRLVDKASGKYCELSNEQVHEKTGHAIRDLLKNEQPQCLKKSTKKKSKSSKSIKRRTYPKVSKVLSEDFYSTFDLAPNDILSASIEISDSLIAGQVQELDLFTNINSCGGVPCTIPFPRPLPTSYHVLSDETDAISFSIGVPTPLPLCSETDIGCADISKVFEILADEY